MLLATNERRSPGVRTSGPDRHVGAAQSAKLIAWSRSEPSAQKGDRARGPRLPGRVPSIGADGDDEWVSQFEAAELLGVSMARIDFLVQGGRLEPVHDGRGRAGVRREAVDREESRRAGAGSVKRLRIFLGDVGRSLARGV